MAKHKFTMEVSYKIGDVLKGPSGLYTVIGYDHIESRGPRTCLAYVDRGEVKWTWLFEAELKMLTNDN